MQQQVFTSKQATNMLSSLPLHLYGLNMRPVIHCTAYTEYQAGYQLQSTRPASCCPANTAYKASNVSYCIHGIQGWSCSVLQPESTITVMCCTATRNTRLCTAATKHNTSNVLYCIQGIQGCSSSLLHAQGLIPVRYSIRFIAFNTFQCIQHISMHSIQHIVYCSTCRGWGRQCRPLHSVQPCYRRLALLRTALHHLGASFPSRSLAAACTFPSSS